MLFVVQVLWKILKGRFHFRGFENGALPFLGFRVTSCRVPEFTAHKGCEFYKV